MRRNTPWSLWLWWCFWCGSSIAVSRALGPALSPEPRCASSALGAETMRDTWSLLTLGDLHMEDDMGAHREARDDCLQALGGLTRFGGATLGEKAAALGGRPAGELSVGELELLLAHKKDGDLAGCHMVSLGDLGRKDIRHEPGDAGTTKSFEDAKEFLDGFGLPYDLVTGNHDLEGLDEFQTDEENLDAFLRCFGKKTPHFYRKIGEKTILLGLSTVRFRDAPFSSHEVHVDDEQIRWFHRTVESHPAEEGWKILVFSHAPIMGSGLRVLQSVHVTNGCAWLNHCSESRNEFIRIVRANPQIKCWASGHFHLSHDFQDSITTVGSCVFLQVGVVGPVSTRDGRRQTRLLQGSPERLRIFTINHHLRDAEGAADLRLDAEVDLSSGTVELSSNPNAEKSQDWFQAYVPREEDGCFLENPDGSIADAAASSGNKVCWWHMLDGKVLGYHSGQLIEYDSETLSPLGVVVNERELGDREVVVVQGGAAVALVDAEGGVEVVHPNDDGSYWRKVQRNKRVRLEEKAREEIAKSWIQQQHEKSVDSGA